MLKRMSYAASPSRIFKNIIDVRVPPTRADVLHQADIMEDVAIVYGYNKLPRNIQKLPSHMEKVYRAPPEGKPLAINKLSDSVRLEVGMAGWTEVVTLILCSHDENFAWLNRKDDGNTAVRLANPKSAEYQVARTSLLPGLLKTIRENRHHSLPIHIFEVSDVAFKDLSLERKSRNERHLAAMRYGRTGGLEALHGLMDHVMSRLNATFVTREEGTGRSKKGGAEYWTSELDGMLLGLFAVLPKHA